MQQYSRRSFLSAIAAGAFVPAWLGRYHQLSAADRNKVKITDIKTMILQGPRTYTLVRVDTDAPIGVPRSARRRSVRPGHPPAR